MITARQRRKVLVLSGGPYVRNLLNLIEKLDVQNAAQRDALLATVNRQRFDAVVVDLRWPSLPSKVEVCGFAGIRPAWDGNLLVITAEINGPKTLDMIEQYLINGAQLAPLSFISQRHESAQ